MVLKIFVCLCALAAAVRGGIVAAPLPYVAPFASSVAAHVTHHSVAAPYVAAPVLPAPVASPLVTAPRIASPFFGSAPLVI
ncbi:UNVERIFIED_CONTAM: hypothetical protein PYX00_008741 [Menopon gallinae]|uniref:Uncharacterized protein n=1 Tax=Menopon gallinae TaxID=328185 RepID=A0AAW2HP40_9NEOP